jgi:hypothetical protein
LTAVLTASLVGLAACSDDPADPTCDAESVTIAGLAASIQALENVQLSAQVTGANCSSADVEWSASDGLEITDQGTVRGVLLGGPFTVTASVGGVDGTADTKVAAADVVADSRWSLAWMNDQTGSMGSISSNYQYSTGGTITSTRSGAGAYRVVFPGVGAQAGQREGVQVSAYHASSGGPRRCRVLSQTTVGNDLAVEVRCHDLGGNPADSRFDVLVTPAGSTTGRSAFLVSTSGQGGVVPATMAHSSVQGAIRVERVAAGDYDVILEGLGRAAVTGSGPETFQITAYGEGTNWCKIQQWDPVAGSPMDLQLNVHCFTAAGVAADAQFSVLMLEKERATRRLGFSWADQASSVVEYAPQASWRYNSAGQVNLSARQSAGVYLATWPGLVRIAGSTAETNLVTAYGNDATYCQVDSWGNFGVVVRCFAADGTPTDSRFTAMWIE